MRKITVIFCLCAALLCGCSSENIANNVLGAASVTRFDAESALEDKIEDIEGVYSATVVIRGRAALIGLVLERGYENESISIKNTAATTAKKSSYGIVSAAVTCNGEITGMIKNLKKLDR